MKIPEEFNSIRIVIADGLATFRHDLRILLDSAADVKVIGEVTDAQSIPVVAQQFQPDVVIVDAMLFYAIASSARTRPAFRALVTVATLDSAELIKAFLHGARAVVPKSSSSDVWHQSIRAVSEGHHWMVSESIAVLVQALQDHFPQDAEIKSPNSYKLTPREIEIIDKIAQGHSNREVGLAFSICERTVKHHLTSIFAKVGVSSRLELALFALNRRTSEAAAYRKASVTSAEGRNLDQLSDGRNTGAVDAVNDR